MPPAYYQNPFFLGQYYPYGVHHATAAMAPGAMFHPDPKATQKINNKMIKDGSAKNTESKDKKLSSERKQEKKDEDDASSEKKHKNNKEEPPMTEAMHYFGHPMPPHMQAYYQKHGMF